ncbi:hypothetical protein GYMLUDRAFT_77838 [Collybiopsis luxurians FD-317 M1]|uniref:Uncharacterized protein n=1 Tax=Collybiopsis luxurians FD-317 M1 TaxID=944289 RepID=A0A0D0BD68_9AGAR|nr:hypothetical protein GYMLUDRAFT_77838 [Collybiopsis luxurians FD-317 M1]
MRLSFGISILLFALAGGAVAAPALESRAKLPIHASWIKPKHADKTDLKSTTGEVIPAEYAAVLVEKAVKANTEKLGLSADNWIWSGFIDAGPKAPEYPGLQLYQKKPVIGAKLYNVPRGKFPATGKADMKTLVILVDPRDPNVAIITDGEKKLS